MKEVDIISEGIAILILSVVGFSFENLFNGFNWLEAFPQKTKRAVLLYMVGLIVCEKKATNTKIASKTGYISHDTLTRLLVKKKQMIGKIPLLLIKYCLSLKTTGYFIIDDFLIPKRYSKEIQGVYNEFDHVDNERMKGMKVVVLFWSDGKKRIPIAWAIWHKEDKIFLGRTAKGRARYEHTGKCLLKIEGQALPYKTKNQIAVELLENVLSHGLKAQYITFDSWYASRGNLQMMRDNAFAFPLECYSRLKSNRKVIYQDKEISVLALARRFEISEFNHKHGAYIKAIEVYLSGYGDINLLLVKQDTHPESGRTKYLFSTDLFASAPQILLKYRGRWCIETAFRDLKQNLNIGSCQAISLDAQEIHLALSLLAFVLLELLPDLEFDGQIAHSLGEKKLLLSGLSLFTDFSYSRHWILDSSKPGEDFVPLELSGLHKVGLRFDFARESLLVPYCQRSA